MKFKVFFFTLIFGLPALAGNGGPGTGFVRHSSPEQVKVAIDSTKPKVWPNIFAITVKNIASEAWTLTNGTYDWDHLKNPLVAKVFKKFFVTTATADQSKVDPSPVLQDLVASPFTVKDQGPCLEFINSKWVDSDAGTNLSLKAPICFSVERIARVPFEVLNDQVVAILAHELTHHFGFGEDEANAVQDFFVRRGRFASYVSENRTLLSIAVYDLKTKIDETDVNKRFYGPGAFCGSLGALTQGLKDVAGQVSSLESDSIKGLGFAAIDTGETWGRAPGNQWSNVIQDAANDSKDLLENWGCSSTGTGPYPGPMPAPGDKYYEVSKSNKEQWYKEKMQKIKDAVGAFRGYLDSNR